VPVLLPLAASALYGPTGVVLVAPMLAPIVKAEVVLNDQYSVELSPPGLTVVPSGVPPEPVLNA